MKQRKKQGTITHSTSSINLTLLIFTFYNSEKLLSSPCINLILQILVILMAFKSSVLRIIIIIPLFFCPLFSSPVFPSSDPPRVQGLLMEQKTRLGSTPPSCYNKCNGCHPCTAVKVPTSPSLRRNQPRMTYKGRRPIPGAISEHDSFSGETNYKPLGWKCCCKGRLYNP